MKYRSFAVVTGASSGIGYELAKQFAKNGFDVLVTADDEGIERVADEIGARWVQVDLANYDGVEKLYTKIKSCGRPLDALAINASGNCARDTELKAELNLIALNLTSSVHLVRRVLSEMVDRKQGRILFTSSIAGRIPVPFEAVYGASQAFLVSFSEALRSELQDFGITVTALIPGRRDRIAEVAREGFEALMAGKDLSYSR